MAQSSPRFGLLELGMLISIFVGGMVGGAIFHDNFSWPGANAVGFIVGLVATALFWVLAPLIGLLGYFERPFRKNPPK